MEKLIKFLDPVYRAAEQLGIPPLVTLVVFFALGFAAGSSLNYFEPKQRVCLSGYSHLIINGQAKPEVDKKGLHLPCQINPKLAD